jgi:hypothetical protein
MKNSKFLIGLMAGLLLGIVFSFILAWQNPDQNPPQGEGMLYSQGENLLVQKHLRIQNGNLMIPQGKLQIGESDDPHGIEMYDTQDGSLKCLRITNEAIAITNGKCP